MLLVVAPCHVQVTDMAKLHVVNPWRTSKTIRRPQASYAKNVQNQLSVLNCDNVNEAWQVLHNCFVGHK